MGPSFPPVPPFPPFPPFSPCPTFPPFLSFPPFSSFSPFSSFPWFSSFSFFSSFPSFPPCPPCPSFSSFPFIFTHTDTGFFRVNGLRTFGPPSFSHHSVRQTFQYFWQRSSYLCFLCYAKNSLF